jgi:sRNA-binding protein
MTGRRSLAELKPARRSAAERHKLVLETLSDWSKRWPVFAARPVKPLKIGIGIDILVGLDGEPVSKNTIRNALQWWTGAPIYLRALGAQGAMRHGLDGEPVGPVSEHDREMAVQMLGKRSSPGATPSERTMT